MQLTQFKNGLDTDLQFYQESLQNLKLAQSKFQESGDSLSRMNQDSDGKQVLVPLTGSMYVPGKLSNPDKVVVDIGTGYYVEKNSKERHHQIQSHLINSNHQQHINNTSATQAHFNLTCVSNVKHILLPSFIMMEYFCTYTETTLSINFDIYRNLIIIK